MSYLRTRRETQVIRKEQLAQSVDLTRLNRRKRRCVRRETRATPSAEKRRSIWLGSLIGHGMKFTRCNAREEHRASNHRERHLLVSERQRRRRQCRRWVDDVNDREARERERWTSCNILMGCSGRVTRLSVINLSPSASKVSRVCTG